MIRHALTNMRKPGKFDNCNTIIAILIAINVSSFYGLVKMVGITEAVMALLYPPVAIILWASFVVVPYERAETSRMTMFLVAISITVFSGLIYPFLLFFILISTPKAWLQYISGWLLNGYQATTTSINAELANVNNYSIGAVHEDLARALGFFLISHYPYVILYTLLAWLLACVIYSSMKIYIMHNNRLVAFLSGLSVYFLLFALFRTVSVT